MAKLPAISAKNLVKALIKNGYLPARQKGSHIQLVCRGKKTITVPLHVSIGKGLLRKIMRDAELSLDDLFGLLGKGK